MSQFSSGKHAKLTADPEPYVRTYNGHSEKRITAAYAAMTERRYENSWGEIVQTRLAGRPEFDRPLTNPANGVLALFRKQRGPTLLAVPHARGFLNGITRLASEGFTAAEIAHARRVLTRLANLTPHPTTEQKENTTP